MPATNGTIHALVFSPDGTCLASGAHDGTAQLWNVGSGKSVGAQDKRKDKWAVVGVAFGPGWGELVLLTQGGKKATDNQFRVFRWDAVANTASLLGGAAGVRFSRRSVAASPRGVALAGHPGIDWYDCPTGKWAEEAFPDAGPCEGVAFDRDMRHLAVAGKPGEVLVYEVGVKKPSRRLKGGKVPATCVRFSPDGTRVLAGDEAGGVWVWDAATGKLVREGEGGPDEVLDITTLDNDEVVSAHGPGDGGVTLRRWSKAAVPAAEASLDGKLRAVAFSPDGRHVATGDLEGELTVWDLALLLADS
ncbi:WD40 repeat domain-containing protein [Urbifossiella limnaea]|nr:hypothetical protein [Urbifossiella limnaea]